METPLPVSAATAAALVTFVAPHSRVQFNIKVNEIVQRRLQAAGVELVTQTPEQRAAVTARQAAASPGRRDAFRAERTDQTGQQIADNGRKVFGWSKNGQELVHPGTALADLEAMGYRLTRSNLRLKQGETMASWFIQFELGEATAMNDVVKAEFDRQFASVFEHAHAYANPDNSINLSLSHRIDAPSVPRTAIRDLRLPADGGIRTFLRK